MRKSLLTALAAAITATGKANAHIAQITQNYRAATLAPASTARYSKHKQRATWERNGVAKSKRLARKASNIAKRLPH